jgi:hypothetical protein
MSQVTWSISGADGNDMPADDVLLAKRAADLLNKKYPYHLWGVHVDSRGGVLNVFCPVVSTRYGFTILLKEVYADPNLRCVMRAGGEILERAALRRRSFQGELAQKVEGIKNYNPILR